MKVDSLEKYGDIRKGNLLTSKDITIWKILSCRDSAFALFASGIAFYNITFFEPFLSVELETYGLVPSQMGYAFLMLSLPYFFAAVLLPRYTGNVPPKLQFVVAFLLTTVAFALMGPS